MYIAQVETASEGKLPSLSEMFRRRDDEWTCDVCMISNKLTAAECVACAAIKPQGCICTIILLVHFICLLSVDTHCVLSQQTLRCTGCKCGSVINSQ